ncbi:hypothetical protein GCM10010124_32310 [Pilimelia terevasa]|uniref:Uncharacterized protein n=1 Tax=Pilimelia terevasa TaxID=53372 RepID=A0A8J3BPH9_9ACTN|nr:hypothetical protein [Pilimelia terevasa]GGK37166.1 hypothetical protein GCM10010124_32310 [Pilimelia terevasa]
MSQYPAPPPAGPYDGVLAVPPPPAPPRARRTGKIILFVLLGLALLCCAGGGAVWLLVKDDVGKVADAVGTEVVVPAALGARRPTTDPQLRAAAAELATVMRTLPAAAPVTGVYGEPGKQDVIMIAAARLASLNPHGDLDTLFTGATGSLSVAPAADVAAGPLGGAARCGAGSVEGQPVVVCGWVDHGSGGLVFAYHQDVARARAEFPAIRAAIEKRG